MQGIGEIERTSPEKNVSLDPEGETVQQKRLHPDLLGGRESVWDEKKKKEKTRKRKEEAKKWSKGSWVVGDQSRIAPDPWMAPGYISWSGSFQPHRIHLNHHHHHYKYSDSTSTTALQHNQSNVPNSISLSKAVDSPYSSHRQRQYLGYSYSLLPPLLPTMDLSQDPQVEEILLRFQNLRSKPARRAVYLSLLDELHTEELRELKDRVDKKDFHCDILGSLPLEVAAQITTYLEVSHLIYLQRVSKRWKFLLSTRLVRDSAVNWRYGRDLVDTDSNDAFVHFVKRRVMLDHGGPVSQSHFSWQLPSYEINRNPMDYCNGKYAWVEMDTFVFVRHLHTGGLQRFCTENRDVFDIVRITDCIVAAFSRHGSCHVWSLESGASGVFHLPSACFEKFVANGTKIAFSFRGNVLQWDFKTQATHAVPIPLGLHLIVLHPTEDRIATVHIALKESGRYIGSIPTDRAEFTVLKFSRSDGVGPFLQRSSEVLDLPSGIGPGGAFYEDVTTRKARCNHRIGSVHINWNHQRDLTEALILTADAYTGRIYMHRTWPGSIHNCGLSMAAVAPDILYYIRKMDGKPSLWISNALSNSEHRLSGPMTRDMRERGVNWEELDQRFILLGDGHSVLLVDPSGMRVWCFDTSSQAFGAVPISY